MQTDKIFKLGMAMLFSLTLASCASTDTDESGGSDGMGGPGDSSSSGNDGNGGATTSGTDPNVGLTQSQIRERDLAMDTTVFYFEFDRSDLSAEARAALVHHANYLKNTPSANYRLEGHADERGTREYNLAL
ncbi:MAG: OmpA family protein, partial [Pseudomonadales bacterium]